MSALLKRFTSIAESQLTTQNRHLSGKAKGLFFPDFTKEKVVLSRHPLDTSKDEYLKVLREDVFPVCQQVVPSHLKLHKHIGNMLEHSVPAYDPLWTFYIEYIYKCVTPEAEQTEENLKRVRILRGAVEIFYSSTSILDDITDKSKERMNKPAWYTVCPEGADMAVYDHILVGYLPFHLLQYFFKDTPGYTGMLEALAQGSLSFNLGQQIELMSSRGLDSVDHVTIAKYKSCDTLLTGAELTMLYSGIRDQLSLRKIRDIFIELGYMYQLLDDVCDVYETPEDNLEMMDARNSTDTWVKHVADKYFNESQRKIFQECSNVADFNQAETIKRLMNEINLLDLYQEEIQKRRQNCSALIKELPHKDLRRACSGLLNWMVAEE